MQSSRRRAEYTPSPKRSKRKIPTISPQGSPGHAKYDEFDIYFIFVILKVLSNSLNYIEGQIRDQDELIAITPQNNPLYHQYRSQLTLLRSKQRDCIVAYNLIFNDAWNSILIMFVPYRGASSRFLADIPLQEEVERARENLIFERLDLQHVFNQLINFYNRLQFSIQTGNHANLIQNYGTKSVMQNFQTLLNYYQSNRYIKYEITLVPFIQKLPQELSPQMRSKSFDTIKGVLQQHIFQNLEEEDSDTGTIIVHSDEEQVTMVIGESDDEFVGPSDEEFVDASDIE